MSSKGVLILGIVFIFLLNVIAVHNYIDSYYYKTPQQEIIQNNSSLSDFFDNIVNKAKDLVNSQIDEDNKSKQKVEKIVLHKQQDKKLDEDLISYKSNYYSEIKDEKKSLKRLNARLNKDNDKNIDKELDKDAIIVLNLNIKDKYIPNNPIIKKIASQMNDKRVVKIRIYQFNKEIKAYLHDIKGDLVDKGVNIDDIKVIFHQDDEKKDKIKILLTKKD